MRKMELAATETPGSKDGKSTRLSPVVTEAFQEVCDEGQEDSPRTTGEHKVKKRRKTDWSPLFPTSCPELAL